MKTSMNLKGRPRRTGRPRGLALVTILVCMIPILACDGDDPTGPQVGDCEYVVGCGGDSAMIRLINRMTSYVFVDFRAICPLGAMLDPLTCDEYGLSTGTHTIRLELAGYDMVEIKFRVGDGETFVLEVTADLFR